MRKVVVIAPLPRHHRPLKLASAYASIGASAEFWISTRGLQDGPSRLRDVRILLAGREPKSARNMFGWYFRWMAAVFTSVLRSDKDFYFHCIGFPSALPVAIASLFARRQFLFDNIDNLSMSFRWPAGLSALIRKLEQFVAARAAPHVIPGAERWPTRDQNIRVVKNALTTQTLREAKAIAQGKGYRNGEKLTIYANGWLVESRGLGILLSAFSRIPADSIQLILAGRLACPEAVTLSKATNVEYIGEVSQEMAVAQYFRSHLAFVYYDPRIPINRVAQPNKWADCILTQTPFVTNAEIETAQPFISTGSCFALPYSDAAGLAKLLVELSKERLRLDEVRHRLEKFEVLPWDVAMGLTAREYLSPTITDVHDSADRNLARAYSSTWREAG